MLSYQSQAFMQWWREWRQHWVIYDPGAHGVNPQILDKAFQTISTSAEFKSAFSFLISRNGCLLGEAHLVPRRGRRLTNMKSVTKSILSLLVGIAIDNNLMAGTHQGLCEFFPELLGHSDQRKRRITIRDLLTMQSGLQWDEWAERYKDARCMFRSKDTVQFVLSRPMAEEPGSTFRYSTGCSQVIAGVLRRVTRQDLLQYACDHLFTPLDISGVKWACTRDGLNCGGTHLYLTPRQMMTLGELCLRRGKWHGRQIVSAGWIDEATRIHAGQGWWEGPYGYHWWVRPCGYCAYGYGGQLIYVVPDQKVVAVLTANPNSRRHILVGDFESKVLDPIIAVIHE
jgi:CubicO group peptidase (beta-lactamase class C family)